MAKDELREAVSRELKDRSNGVEEGRRDVEYSFDQDGSPNRAVKRQPRILPS